MTRHLIARGRSTLGALVGALLLAACATPSILTPDTDTPSATGSQDGGRLKPMPIRPLNIQADCHFKDEAGYGASALLDVSYSEVRRFAASVNVPKRGSCHFDLADFEQVRKEPHVELRARDGCVVRMWEQGDQVTVAFAQCASRCDRGTFDYVWPILVDRPSGRCN